MCKRAMGVFLLLAWFSIAWAGVSAQFDRSRVAMGETLQLQIKVDGQAAGLPNLTALEDKFVILGTTRSEEIKVINGKSQVQQQWLLVLTPKQRGDMTIPGIQLGKLRTQPLRLTVMPARLLDQDAQGEVFIVTKLEPKRAYAQSQFIYTARVYVATQVSSATFMPPEADNATILRLGKDRTFSAQYKARQYRVLEQRFAIFPQKAGNLRIKPPIFMGRKLNNQAVRIVGQTQTLDVQPIPTAYKNKIWLPARKITLEQTWSATPAEWRAGDPVTRTILLTAIGLPAEQLPQLQASAPSGVQVYPDKEETHNFVQEQWIKGQRQVKIAYIPTQEGKIALPAITIKWWDRFTHKARTASLPAQTITVLPALTSAQKTIVNPTPTVASTMKMATNQSQTSGLWKMLAVLFALAWLVTLVLFLLRKRQVGFLKQIKVACYKNQSHDAARLLLLWAQQQWPGKNISSLTQLADCFESQELQRALQALDRLLYADNKAVWAGSAFWKLFAKAAKHKKHARPQSDDVLPAL